MQDRLLISSKMFDKCIISTAIMLYLYNGYFTKIINYQEKCMCIVGNLPEDIK